ncbi:MULTISPECIES: ribonuclease P protein component [Kytococcus]|uniref:Ribonuclease P protein component n=1 Tax=Kytococcus schroeteri TaxID=138300 RepID=A0A2I1PCS7_9MICO|nr:MULTISPECIES: ribonuclease P protein component [Kytococcus]OFS07354.1 ribonuclease P protein component [Kytococcus sp. HMSC28H12]PKZ42438.1 ribonuclease P protein component [Kytococcus schroeteri]
MLAARHRLRRSRDFTAVLRGTGRRKGSSTTMSVVLTPRPSTPDQTDPHPVRVGFVVSKQVGNSVVRSRVQRRLRHLVADRLADLPAGHDLVVRAHPASATAEWSALVRDLDRCLARAVPRGA